MKIIISNYDDLNNPYYGGGGAISIHQIAKSWTKKHEVQVITSKYPKADDKQILEGVIYKRIGIGIFGPKLDQIIFLILLPFYVVFEKYDIWIENLGPPISGSFLQLFTKKPVIGRTSFMNADMMSKKYFLPFDLFEKINLKTYRYFIANTKEIKNKISQINKKAWIKIIPAGGIDDKYFKKRSKEKNYILFLGRIDIFQKGIDILLKLIPDVLHKYQTLKLIIAGDGISSDVKKLREEIDSVNLSNKIILTGKTNGKNKLNLLSECLVFISLSRYETFGMSVLEALALGKPAIVFDIPGYKWIPDDCAVKISPFKTEIFSEEIIKLLRNKKRRDAVGLNARRYAERFTWSKIIKIHENFLGRVYRENYEN